MPNGFSVGTSSALQPDIEPGDLVISTGCIRETGTRSSSLMATRLADHQMVMALVQACGTGILSRGYRCLCGWHITKPHLFQDRDIPSQIAPRWLNKGWSAHGNGGCHRDGSCPNTWAASAAICTVGSNLVTLKAPTAPITSERAIRVVCRSVQIMNEWDSLCARHKKKYYYPSLERTVRQ